MASERQIAANRANAAHSTGPRTPEGKAASKANRLTHGLDSAAPVVPGESRAEWEAHRAGILASFAPVGPLETELADRAALLFWRLRRVARYETGAVAATVDHAVGTLTGEFDPADPVQGTFGRVSPVPTPYSVAGLRTRLAEQQAELDRQCARSALLKTLRNLPDDHPIPGPTPGQLLDGVCNDECLTSITDPEVVADLNLPDDAWEDLIGWDGWTAGTVRAVLAAIGKAAERTRAQLLDRAGRRIDREITAQRGEVARREAALARAEADLGPATDLARKTSLLPSEAMDKVVRYEAHLSRQLSQTLQLLDRFQTARAAGRLHPPAAEEWESEPVPPVGRAVDSAERSQHTPQESPGATVRSVPPVDRGVGSADRSQSGSVGSPVVASERKPFPGRTTAFADRTQAVEPFLPVVGSGSSTGRLDGIDARARESGFLPGPMNR